MVEFDDGVDADEFVEGFCLGDGAGDAVEEDEGLEFLGCGIDADIFDDADEQKMNHA